MTDDIYSALVENSSQAIFVFDIHKEQFVYINEAFREMFNFYDQEKETLSHFRKILPEEEIEYLKRKYKELQSGQLEEYAEFRLQPPDKEERWVRLSNIPIKQNKKLLAGYAIDITSEVVNMTVYQKYANKKNSILNILSHDLRGPLGIAQMANSIVSSREKEKELSKFVKTTKKVLDQAIHLISDLTKREFLETAEVVLNKKRINVSAKLQEMIEEYQNPHLLTEKKFRFSSSSSPIFLELDESKFVQVINNLITNAIKFTDPDGTIELRVTEKPDSVLFEVKDNGIGIPVKHHEVLFQEFTPASRTGLNGEPTVGLGMSVSKTIVEWHKGTIWFESEENKGTSVYFELPK